MVNILSGNLGQIKAVAVPMLVIDANGNLSNIVTSGSSTAGFVRTAGDTMLGSLLTSPSGVNDLGSLTSPYGNIYANAYKGDTFGINYVFDGGGSVLQSGSQGHLEIPYACTPRSWTMTGDVSGVLSVDVRRVAYGSWTGEPVASSNSIVGTEEPLINSGFKGTDTDLTTWSGVNQYDLLNFHIDANPTNVTRATLAIRFKRV